MKAAGFTRSVGRPQPCQEPQQQQQQRRRQHEEDEVGRLRSTARLICPPPLQHCHYSFSLPRPPLPSITSSPATRPFLAAALAGMHPSINPSVHPSISPAAIYALPSVSQHPASPLRRALFFFWTHLSGFPKCCIGTQGVGGPQVR